MILTTAEAVIFGIVALAAAVSIGVGHYRRENDVRQKDAAAHLARNGYRIEDGVLYVVKHDDPDGWWTKGEEIGPARSPLDGVRLISNHPSLLRP